MVITLKPSDSGLLGYVSLREYLLVLCDTTHEAMSIVLPDIGNLEPNPLIVKNVGTHALTITSTQNQLIDGALSYSLPGQFDSVTLYHDGMQSWYISSLV